MRFFRPLMVVTVCLFVCAALVQCAGPDKDTAKNTAPPTGATARGAARIQGVNLNDPIRPAVDDNAIVVGAAKNEWASFAIQITSLPKPTKKSIYTFRVQPLRPAGGAATIETDNLSAAQILPMPVDVNRAGFVRHTGLNVSSRPLPRALLPVTMDRGSVNLSSVRDPSDPTNPQAHPGKSSEPLLFWIDLHVPPETAPGEYVTTCDLFGSESRAPLASVPVKITIYDFVLPDERHLVMTSQLGWDDLKQLYSEQFETIRPQLLNRTDPHYAAAIKTLDSIVKLAALNRTEVVIPRLQPTAKWPSGKPPQIDWEDLDSVVTPWFSGEAFADKIPLSYWPLPPVDFLDRFDRQSQLEYWTAAATHFDQKEWLARSPIALELPVPGRAGAAESLQMSADAAQILAAHPHVRVTLPLEEDQIQLATADNKSFIDPNMVSRLLAASPGIVFATPMQKWPLKQHPQHWLRTDVPGLVPYVGAGGDERDTRVWSWLAYLRQAGVIQWGSPLPRTRSSAEPADPNDLVWFYPGSWFGVEDPVPSIQLKWLRRAQQDYEYLWLARQRGEVINATLMARLIARPVEIQPGQAPDPIDALLTGTADPGVWTDAQKLLAKVILLREPGQQADTEKEAELNLELLRFSAPQDQVLLMARSTEWGFEPEKGNFINLVLGVDLYNASDTHPDRNHLYWEAMPRGWEVSPRPSTIPALATYHIDRFPVEARFDLNAIDANDHRPAGLRFVNGFNNAESKLQFVLPVAATDRLGPGLNIKDGKLDDWDLSDSIQDGPMVRMFNRPALQKQEIQAASESSRVYSGWSDDNFYVAFKVAGVQTNAPAARNFVDYQFRRAWGEDLCEILIQPIYDDNSVGPVLHVVCKPAEHWVERKRDARLFNDPWQPFEGAGIRYARTLQSAGDHAGEWNGEVSIPWKAITDQNKVIPKLLRFNFVQHVHDTGESASWAGPIDFGRDDSFMGLLYVRDAANPGNGVAGGGR
jgi:hypothetical protein